MNINGYNNDNNNMIMSRGGNNMNERRLEAARRRHAMTAEPQVVEAVTEMRTGMSMGTAAERRGMSDMGHAGERLSGVQGREALMNQIMMQDFVAAELNLYLDTHPQDTDTLRMHRETVDYARALKDEYESRFGPITHMGVQSETHWSWKDDPWPWDAR